MGRPPAQPSLPTYLEALDAAEICLRSIGSDWERVPILARIMALSCANNALAVLMLAGRR